MADMISPLHRLADDAGVARHWRDADGRDHVTDDHALSAVLTRLGYRADSAASIRHSQAQLDAERWQAPALLTGDVHRPVPLPIDADQVELTGEDGATFRRNVTGRLMDAVDQPGYFRMWLAGNEVTLAIAPTACPLPAPREGARLWGPAVQIPALRGMAQSAFGDFGDLDRAVQAFAARGADAVAINPVHAMFPGHGVGYSPYSPSSRQFLNGAMAAPALLGLPELPRRPGGPMIDWATALPQRLADLRSLFASLSTERRAMILNESEAHGPALVRHALFDALDCHFRPNGAQGWQDWPAALYDPLGAAAQAFAQEHAEEIAFHLFVQWLAREGLGLVQQRAQQAGMGTGLIADLAVGVDARGSDAWAMRDAMLDGLTIGAPPDPLGPHGQNWNLTSFSPAGLRRTGFAPFIAMIRAALSSAGGLRIDHAFGLSRLWVIPDGEPSSNGAYLHYPFLDLVRIATLEAHMAGAMIIAEDLGTSPFGFTDAIAQRNMAGMRILWFQRAADDGFIGAQDYPAMSVAMTGTHDTPTVAGWWRGRDIDWADRLGRLPEGTDRAKAEDVRAWDRGLLWSTIGDGGPRPAPDDTAPILEAALSHIARTPACLVIAPVEDVLGLDEQPNLPGTIDEHPNWRRRLDHPLEEELDRPDVARRIVRLSGG